MKEYTRHYQIGGDNRLRMLSSKAVKRTEEKMEKRAKEIGSKSKALSKMKAKVFPNEPDSKLVKK